MLTTVATAFGSTVLRSTVLGSTLFGSTGPQPVLPGFLNSLSSPLGHYGLWAVLLFVLVEDFGIPVPGETILIAAAIFAGSGRLNVVAVGLIGFGAAVLGDNIGYGIGRFGGRTLVERWGKYVFITAERLDTAEGFFHRHGGKIIVIARFVEGLRQANGLIAGIAQMKWLRFLSFNALGAALWVGTWVSVGYFAGRHITTIYNDITRYSLYAAIAAAVLIAAWVVVRVRRHRRARGLATAEAEDAGAPEAADTAVLEASDADPAVEASDAGTDPETPQADGENISGTESAADSQDARPPDVHAGTTTISAQGAEADPSANGHLPAEGDLPAEAARRPRGGPGDLAVREVVAVGGDQDADRAGGAARAGARVA